MVLGKFCGRQHSGLFVNLRDLSIVPHKKQNLALCQGVVPCLHGGGRKPAILLCYQVNLRPN